MGNSAVVPEYSRRRVLRYGVTALGVAAATLGVPGGRAMASEPVDVAIIGSGYAGSVAALRLAQAGISSVVLERGRRWPITAAGDTFATITHPDGRAAWLSTTSPFTDRPLNIFTGVLEAFTATGVVCLAGAGVGGGSLVNYAVMREPTENLFQQSFGDTLDYTEMDTTWYPRARQLIGVAPIPDDVLNSGYYANARAFQQAAESAGFPSERVDMAMNWQIVRNEIAGTAVPSAIEGDAMFGINSGAKRSVDNTILATAEQSGKATVLPLHQVVNLGQVGDRYQIDCQQIDEQGTVLATPSFTARYVFLAAGSLGTSRLLVRAKARGTLPALNDQVGANWGTGGDHIVGRAGLPLQTAAQGGPSHIMLRNWANSLGPVSMLSFPLGAPVLGIASSTALATAIVPPLGKFEYQALTDSVQLNWPAADPRVLRVTTAVTKTANRLSAAEGLGLELVSPLLTSHSTGGAVLGKATDASGQVIGHPNLFVIDAALIPGSTGAVPPALTITALADRLVTGALDGISVSASF